MKKGEKLMRTGRYLIKTTKGKKRKFYGTLLKTFNFGKLRLALFSVPK